MQFKQGQFLIDKIRGKLKINKYQEWLPKEGDYRKTSPIINIQPNSFYDIFRTHNNLPTQKWEQYLHIYEKHLKMFKEENKPVNLLEIGVDRGGSLEVWSKYLPKNSQITGIDINPKCAEIEFNNPNIKVFIGSASDVDFINTNFSDANFDIIIDDGSHICSDVITTFEEFFPKLTPGGLYIIEDLHTSYNKKWGGSYKSPKSSIEYFKNFIDYMNFRYIPEFPIETTDEQIEKMKKMHEQIASLTAYDSVIIIEKYNIPKYRAFKSYETESKNITKEELLSQNLTLCNTETRFEKFFK